MIFIVIKEGVYRHEIKGVYGSLSAAEARAGCLSADDDYHSFEVYEAVEGNCEDVEHISWFRQGSNSKQKRKTA